MFEHSDAPRLFGLPPGVDFAEELVNGLLARISVDRPEAMARVTVFVNTRRMQRRIKAMFGTKGAMVLPRIRLITDLANDPLVGDPIPPISPLRRRLEVSQLVAKLIAAQPDLAPRAALYDLSDSLCDLIDEMHGEGVPPEVISSLDVTDLSGHWERSLSFLEIARPFFGQSATAPDQEARQRRVIEALRDAWAASPVQDPVIIAGSTGSRGATALFLRAVLDLPQGAVVLPGYDFDMPEEVWATLGTDRLVEDHPQARFWAIRGGVTPVAPWTEAVPPNPARNKLISLSLRPAPITDQWLLDGPMLGDVGPACKGLTYLCAPSPRIEAEAIALRLRKAVDEGITAALITPDRMLTRQVTAALDRWDITPDDSAGQPLQLSPPGRFLRHVGALIGAELTSVALLSLLKHPLCHSGKDRRQHLLRTRDLELHIRKKGIPFPTAADLSAWADKTGTNDPGRMIWADWVGAMTSLAQHSDLTLAAYLTAHLTCAEALAAGPETEGSGGLWDMAAGREAIKQLAKLKAEAEAAGQMSPQEYRAIFDGVLGKGEVRDRDKGHPGILIWGTLEARVQGADLMILGGMNEGTWPESPAPDPWLNRNLRQQAGLLLPERRIGLSAHDYAQAVAAKEVWITRAVKTDDADTVPSRWVNRLTNLLQGLKDQGGPEAFAAIRARGDAWVRAAVAMSDAPRVPRAGRPAPRPPAKARPKRISVTDITRLQRDPYAIYAKSILRLYPMDPMTPEADGRLRGIAMHSILEAFIKGGTDPADPNARQALLDTGMRILERDCPWPAIRLFWFARLEAVADWFLSSEVARRAIAQPAGILEVRGEIEVGQTGITLAGIADRIDLTPDGQAVIYDYKTGTPPSAKVQVEFDRQLLIESAMVERGGFADLGPMTVRDARYIALGSGPKEVPANFDAVPTGQVWEDLVVFLMKWQDPRQGYRARLSMASKEATSLYDHLARFGEWDISSEFVLETLT